MFHVALQRRGIRKTSCRLTWTDGAQLASSTMDSACQLVSPAPAVRTGMASFMGQWGEEGKPGKGQRRHVSIQQLLTFTFRLLFLTTRWTDVKTSVLVCCRAGVLKHNLNQIYSSNNTSPTGPIKNKTNSFLVKCLYCTLSIICINVCWQMWVSQLDYCSDSWITAAPTDQYPWCSTRYPPYFLLLETRQKQ